MNLKNLKTWQKVAIGLFILFVVVGIFADPENKKTGKTKTKDQKSEAIANQQNQSVDVEKVTKQKPMENQSPLPKKEVDTSLSKQNQDFGAKIRDILKSKGLDLCAFDKFIQTKKDEFTAVFNEKYSQYPGADVEDSEYNAYLKKNVLEAKGLGGQDVGFIVHVEQLAIKEKCNQK